MEYNDIPILTGGDLKRVVALRAQAQQLRVDCPPDGALNAKIAIVAEHPGDNEVRLRSPLVGTAGKLLWTHLNKVKVDRSQCWVTNAIKRIVVKDKASKKSDVSNTEMHHWRELLLWELGSLPNLQYVLVLGDPALQALTGRTGITFWRGTVEQREDGRWYSYAFNPAMVVREPKFEPVFSLDMFKFAGMMEGRYREYTTDPIINPSPNESIEWITKLRDEAHTAESPPISYDIETMANETACIGLTNDDHRGMCINFRDRRTNRWTVSEERSVREHIAQLLGDPAVKLIAQNGNFDSYWLWYKDRIRVQPSWLDTMLAHHTLYPSLPHSLAFLVAQYTWHPYYKDEKDIWRETDGNIEDFWRYNVKDICLTRHVGLQLHKELKAAKLDTFFFNHVMRLQPHLTEITVGGVLIDAQLKARLTDELRIKCNDLRATFEEACVQATGDDTCRPNPRSPGALRKLFFERLHLVGRGTSVDAENRKRMLDHPRTPVPARNIITALDAFIEEDKFRSTFVESRLDEDGRMRCEYTQHGVARAPGRLSSKGTMWGSGLNLQNQPERAKVMYVADPGYGFVYFDMSQIEARIVGWHAEIPKWIAQFEQARLDGKYDAHRALASEMFGVPYDEVPTKDRDESGRVTIRFVAKRCRHGLNYRMGPDRLATTTGLPIAEAMHAYGIYHRNTPELQRWWKWLETRVLSERQLVNAFGRRMLFMGRIDEEALESIVAFYPQSTAGDHVSATIYLCHDDPDWPCDARIRLNVHDALIALVPLDKRMQCATIMKKHAERPIPITSILNKHRQLIVPAEFGFSQPDEQGIHRWSTIQKIKM